MSASHHSDAIVAAKRRRLQEAVDADKSQQKLTAFFQRPTAPPQPQAVSIALLREGIESAAATGASSVDVDCGNVHVHVEYPPQQLPPAEPVAVPVIGTVVVAPPPLPPPPPAETASETGPSASSSGFNVEVCDECKDDPRASVEASQRHPKCDGYHKKLCLYDCAHCLSRSIAGNARASMLYVGERPARLLIANSDKKVEWKCSDCAHRWQASGNSVVGRNSGCPYCAGKSLCGKAECNRCFTRSICASERGSVLYAGEENPLLISSHSHRKVKWKCDVPGCNHVFWAHPGYVCHQQSRVCPYCNGKQLCGDHSCIRCTGRSISSSERGMLLYAGETDPHKIFMRSGKDVKWKCDDANCGHTWFASPHNVLGTGQKGCPYCGGQRLCGVQSCISCTRRSLAGSAHAMRLYAGDENPLTISIGSNKILMWRCDDPDCAHTWQMSAHALAGCPVCTSSRAERLVCEYLKSSGAKFSREWTNHSCRDKLPLRFDFHLTKWHDCIVSFILELDGLQHFKLLMHGPSAFAINRAHDLHKMRWALKRGIPVVRLTSRAVEYFNKSTWEPWLARVRDEYIAPLTRRSVEERRLVVLEDTPRYRQMFSECIETDPELGPFVRFVAH